MNINKLLTDSEIQSILLSKGFKLKEQKDGTMALNSYVLPAIKEIISTINLRVYVKDIYKAEEIVSSLDVERSFKKLLDEGNYDSTKWKANDNNELVYVGTGDHLVIDDGVLEFKVKDKSSVHLRFDSWHLMTLYSQDFSAEFKHPQNPFSSPIDDLEKDALRIFETMILYKVSTHD